MRETIDEPRVMNKTIDERVLLRRAAPQNLEKVGVDYPELFFGSPTFSLMEEHS